MNTLICHSPHGAVIATSAVRGPVTRLNQIIRYNTRRNEVSYYKNVIYTTYKIKLIPI